MSTPRITGSHLPLLDLLNPRQYTGIVLATLALGLGAVSVAMRLLNLPLWVGTMIVVGLLLIPGAIKWRSDMRLYGATATLLSILLAAQGFHTVEHLVQWFQYHVLNWTARASSGLISAANVEWVHFVWNWLVLAMVILLIRGGMRNIWMWLLLIWATAHTFEHTYMFIRYIQVLDDLRQMGVTNITAQGLPGILGRDGWLARSDATRGTFLCTLPGLATAPRLDVHFWWNIGEIALLLPAGNTFMRHKMATTLERQS